MIVTLCHASGKSETVKFKGHEKTAVCVCDILSSRCEEKEGRSREREKGFSGFTSTIRFPDSSNQKIRKFSFIRSIGTFCSVNPLSRPPSSLVLAGTSVFPFFFFFFKSRLLMVTNGISLVFSAILFL